MFEIRTIPQNKFSHNDGHYTVLGFTILDGSPVLCVIIIASIKQKYDVETRLALDPKIVGDPPDSGFCEE